MRILSTSHLRATLTTVALASTVLAGACAGKTDAQAADQGAVDNTSAAATGARRSDDELRRSRDVLARETAANATDVGARVAAKAHTDAEFVDRRDEVVLQSRASLQKIQAEIGALDARMEAVKEPAMLRSALDAVAAAEPLAAAAVEQIALATPETWDVRRKTVESSFATLDAAYQAAARAAR